MPPSEQCGSVEANNMKRGIFTVDGSPVVFFFHQSVTEGGRNKLSTKIQENGGEVSDETEEANILLYDPKRTKEALLVIAYGAHSNHKLRDLWLKPVAQVEHSIGAVFQATSASMPDSGGGTRLKFSQDDKRHLGQYLTSPAPIAANSISLYNELVDLYTEEYEWVQRRSARSWLAHYKSNKAYFDALISDQSNQNGPNHDRHCYSPTRELNHGVKRTHNDHEEEEDEDEVENSEHIRFLNRKRRRTCAAREEEERHQIIIARREEEEEEDSEEDLAPTPASCARPKNTTTRPSGTIPRGPQSSRRHRFFSEEEEKNVAEDNVHLPLEDSMKDEEVPVPLFSGEEGKDEDKFQPPLENSKNEDQVPAPLFLKEEKEETQVSLFMQHMEVEEDTMSEEAQESQNSPSTQALARFKNRRAKKALMTPSTEDTGARTKLKEMQDNEKATPYVPPSGSRAAKHLLQRSL
ncbi:hypothetical protein CPB85DRAFT_1433228 [Mucidula mucida]|nr:hypothetical protein CPB85DRAFT_1433228 [Mucidula mucida]